MDDADMQALMRMSAEEFAIYKGVKLEAMNARDGNVDVLSEGGPKVTIRLKLIDDEQGHGVLDATKVLERWGINYVRGHVVVTAAADGERAVIDVSDRHRKRLADEMADAGFEVTFP